MDDGQSSPPLLLPEEVPVGTSVPIIALPDGPPTIDGQALFPKLINEELAKVFSFLNQEDRQRIRGVSRTWRDVVDIFYGLRIRIKNSTSDLVRTSPKAVEVELHSMTQPFISGISFAETVRKLVFANIVVTYNLVSFLRNCNNVTYLGFSNIILDIPINDPWSPIGTDTDYPIQMHSLETLEIKCFTFIEGVVEIMNFLHDKMSFKKLKEIIVNVQNPPVVPFQLIFLPRFNVSTAHPLVKLLAKVRPTLRKFVIGRMNMPTVLKFYPPPEESEEEDEGEGEFTPPQLEHLEIHPYFREEWGPILRDQIGIRIMNLGSCNVSRWPEIQDSIIVNSLSLESFTIGGLSFGQVWDCAVFQGCIALRSLSIEISHSNKLNLALLPLELKNLHIFGPVPKHEITAVSETLTGLETLTFTHLGRLAEFNNAEEEKVTLDLFKALLQLPNLKKLTFATCSTISIDWDLISLWCASVDNTPGFTYSEKYFSSHGEYFRNGICVEIKTEEFKRDDFDWTLVPAISLSEMASHSSTITSASETSTLSVFPIPMPQPEPDVPEDQM